MVSFPSISHRPSTEQRPRVLLILGDRDRREAVHLLLEGEGYELISVEDTEEVFRLAAEFDPDIIILDIDLPHNAGLEMCGELRASDLQHRMPIVLAGESAEEEIVAQALYAGADDFLTSSRPLELRARVRVQLRNKRYRDALARVRSERDNLLRDLQVDALTGVLNRRSLEQAIGAHREARERFAVMFGDIDHFKLVNDRHGHAAGDVVLKGVAEVLKRGVRPGDAVGRHGGEEFVLLIAGAGREAARLVAERHRKAVEALDFSGVGPRRVTISIGVAVFDPLCPDETVHDLVKRADQALYRAKADGRNRVVMSAPNPAPPAFEPVHVSVHASPRESFPTIPDAREPLRMSVRPPPGRDSFPTIADARESLRAVAEARDSLCAPGDRDTIVQMPAYVDRRPS